MAGQVRALVALFPDWPVVAARRPLSASVAVVGVKGVEAVSPAARAARVRVGMRRREAEASCPCLEVLARDLAGEARRWEPAVAAVEAFAPGVEVLRPGLLAIGAKGPARYFGGEQALGAKVASAVEAAVREAGVPDVGSGCRVGVADGLFAAGLAASNATHGEPLVVPRGASAGFLAPLSLRVLAAPDLAGTVTTAGLAELVDLLGRLGLRTLGDFAALPAASVTGRFGAEGLLAHRLARGLPERPLRGRVPPPDWVVSAEIDPPAADLQAAVFVGRALAEQLYRRLAGQGLVCTRLAILAETEPGGTLRRSWRHDGSLSAAAVGERVRWQLEGWSKVAGLGPVVRLALLPEEVRPDTGRQLGLWGADAGAEDLAARALARVQSMLGPEAVLSAVLQGGRDYEEQVRLLTWGEPREPLRAGRETAGAGYEGDAGALRAAGGKGGTARGGGKREGPPPWPGRLPGLAPATVHHSALPALVLDENGRQVGVGARGAMSARPTSVVLGPGGSGPRLVVVAWAGPWPLLERWWEAGGRRRARLLVCTEATAGGPGAAYLLAREKGSWWVEATYD